MYQNKAGKASQEKKNREHGIDIAAAANAGVVSTGLVETAGHHFPGQNKTGNGENPDRGIRLPQPSQKDGLQNPKTGTDNNHANRKDNNDMRNRNQKSQVDRMAMAKQKEGDLKKDIICLDDFDEQEALTGDLHEGKSPAASAGKDDSTEAPGYPTGKETGIPVAAHGEKADGRRLEGQTDRNRFEATDRLFAEDELEEVSILIKDHAFKGKSKKAEIRPWDFVAFQTDKDSKPECGYMISMKRGRIEIGNLDGEIKAYPTKKVLGLHHVAVVAEYVAGDHTIRVTAANKAGLFGFLGDLILADAGRDTVRNFIMQFGIQEDLSDFM